jgi:hypothetical protein
MIMGTTTIMSTITMGMITGITTTTTSTPMT